MPEFTSLVMPAGPGMFRRTELSERTDFCLRLDFLAAGFFFNTFFFEFLELGFLEAGFLRPFFFVGIRRKVYHHQIQRTMRD
jgi:hypothetical protein